MTYPVNKELNITEVLLGIHVFLLILPCTGSVMFIEEIKLCCLLIFFKINFFEKYLHEYHQNVKQFGSRFVGPGVGQNYLHRL